jgi:hypothetical protein
LRRGASRLHRSHLVGGDHLRQLDRELIVLRGVLVGLLDLEPDHGQLVVDVGVDSGHPVLDR